MRLALAVTTAVALGLATGAAWAQGKAQHQDPFMSDPPTETVYATDHHMGFSIRASLIRWLGGVPVARQRDLEASQKEKWWGESVPLLPADIVTSHN